MLCLIDKYCCENYNYSTLMGQFKWLKVYCFGVFVEYGTIHFEFYFKVKIISYAMLMPVFITM